MGSQSDNHPTERPEPEKTTVSFFSKSRNASEDVQKDSGAQDGGGDE